MSSAVRAGLVTGREERTGRPSSPCVRHRPYHFARQRREIPGFRRDVCDRPSGVDPRAQPQTPLGG